MKAAVISDLNQPVRLEQVPDPMPHRGEVLVEVRAAALNRRDYFITQGLYPGISFPVIPGSDGCVQWRGRDYLVNPNNQWGEDSRCQSADYHILGMPTNGTLAQRLTVREDRLVPKPEHLSTHEAAALPLAGMTAYRVLFSKCAARSGEQVLISGVGGGVALMALQFALAAGCKVWVTSGSDEKVNRAIALGASGGANYRTESWEKRLLEDSGGFDVVIDSAAGTGFAKLVKLCRPAARVGLYGGTTGKIDGLSPQLVFWRQLTIFGSTMGSDAEFQQMVAFVDAHGIRPVIDSIFPLQDTQKAIDRMGNSLQFGKIVIDLED